MAETTGTTDTPEEIVEVGAASATATVHVPDMGAASAAPSRDDMRAKIFGAKPKTATVEDFFGVTIELRQPSLGVALSKRDESEEDRVFTMLTDYAFVPGTNQRLFELEDINALRELPFGGEFQRLMTEVNTLLGIDPKMIEDGVKDAEKSS